MVVAVVDALLVVTLPVTVLVAAVCVVVGAMGAAVLVAVAVR